jgi:16S rRNA (cytosine1402-N4)-methyltransferase
MNPASPSPASWSHDTVLLEETVSAVLGDPNGVYVDGTFGRGGHSRLLLSRLGPGGRLLAIDRDAEAVASALHGPQAISDARFSIHHARFAQMDELLRAQGVAAVQGVMLDLGVSSPQLDDPQRGFSFRFDAPLDMRMDNTRGESAAQYLARAGAAELAEVLRDYGEERFAVPIAKAIVARRDGGHPIERTGELAALVAGAVKTREPGQNPATRTFQALRILVNGELEELEQGLNAAMSLLAPHGRLAVISFHSLEDRRVKQFMSRLSREQVDRRSPAYWSGGAEAAHALRLVARIKPGPAEVAANARARSAVLRVAERTEAPWTPAPTAVAGAPSRAAGRRRRGA